jgi:inner membrane protein
VDNLTHSLTGWALGQAGLKTKSRKGLAALILGANAPDIDVFFFWAPWEPLATHRGVTHSLIGGVIVLPAMLWALLMLLDRWQVARGTRFKSGLAMDPRWLLALCYIGAITHPWLDLQTTYAVQLFSPLSGRWFHSDSLFIIDVWLWALLGLTIAWSRMREKQRRANWQRPVQRALVAAFAYICLNLGLSERATADVRARHPKAEAIFASPQPVKSWQRRMSWRNDEAVHRAPWRIGGGLRAESGPIAANMDDPIVRRAIREDPNLRRFLYWSVMPVARVTRDGCQATVEVADARYSLPGEGLRGPGVPATRVDLCA